MFHKGFGNRFTEPRARRSSIHGRLIGRMKIGCPNIPLGRYWDPLYPISFCWCESRLILVIQLNQGVLNYFRTPWAELNNCISSYLQLLHFSYRSLFANVLPEQASAYILLCPSKPSIGLVCFLNLFTRTKTFNYLTDIQNVILTFPYDSCNCPAEYNFSHIQVCFFGNVLPQEHVYTWYSG